MLVVILVIAIIIGLGAPIVKNISSGNPVTNGADAISGFLSNARVQAIAQNTYVVVGFFPASPDNAKPGDPDDLQMAAVRLLNNTFDPNQVYNATNPGANNPAATGASSYRAIGSIVHLKNVTLQPYTQLPDKLRSKLTLANVPPTPPPNSSTTTADFIDCSIKADPSKRGSPATPNAMSFKLPANTFTWCLIAFTPQGEALYFPSFPAPNTSATPFYTQLFIGLNTCRGGNAVDKDPSAAGIVLDGGGGNVRTFRL